MSNLKDAVFAGGCFWCMVKPFNKFDGVKEVIVGYTGGNHKNPTYEDVCSGTTGHYEAVKIIYDEEVLKYEELLDAFFMSIDPTDEGGQFFDRGQSYETAVFYTDDSQRVKAIKYINELENSKIFNKPITVKVLKYTKFYVAEDYHQDYYLKNPFKYSSYYEGSGRKDYVENNNPIALYKQNQGKKLLTPIQHFVTIENGTEPPFENEYCNNFAEGIYVDVITGSPLFSSKDKFHSSCGWPAFSKPINNGYIKENEDLSHGMIRTEVRSSNCNSHLGHVFEDGPKESGGLRYCINSAALKFIPREDMVKEGYGEYLKYI